MTDVVYRGHLFKKKKGFFSGYEKGWWVLTNESLKKMSGPAATDKMISEIPMNSVEGVAAIKRSARLEITLKNRQTRIFKCESVTKREKWVDAFDDVLPKFSGGRKTTRKSWVSRKSTKSPHNAASSIQESATPPSGVPSNVLQDVRDMGDRGMKRVSMRGTGNENVSKAESSLMDQMVFMGKARNFAVSTKKDEMESMRKKGHSLKRKSDIEEESAGNKRQAILPQNLPDEDVAEERFVKTDAQKAALSKVLTDTLGDALGGNLFSEVEVSEVVGLLYSQEFKAGEQIFKQGDTTLKMYVVETGSFGVYTRDFIDEDPEFVESRTNGAVFGELSLLYNTPAPFDVKADVESQVWALPRKKFQELTAKTTKKKVNKRVRFLENVPLIADNLEREALLDLADSMLERTYADGEYVSKAGTLLDRLFIIQKGSALLIDGSEILDDVLEGESYGEWALLEMEAKSDFSLISKGETVMLELVIAEMVELIGPLKDYVMKKWVDEKGAEFFFSGEQPRGGTVYDPSSDLYNPQVPESNRTMAFGGSKKPDKKTEGEKVEYTAELEEQVVKDALNKAKERETVGFKEVSRKTVAGKKDEVLRKTVAASKGIPEDEVTDEQIKIAFEATEDDDKSFDEDEDNLDKEFVPAPPVRDDLTMETITPCALLGRGNFGRVHLCRNENDHDELFALKVLARHFIVSNGWETLIENERNAMMELAFFAKSPFLLNLYTSFFDSKNIYLLLELCEGGDLYNLLRLTRGNKFNEEICVFYMACVIQGLAAMHSREIIYRDLKPENLMLAKNGYVKVADFGLAKKTLRTFTVCGTPDYMAPEVILSRGHGAAVDWWAIGVLLFEMLGAVTPFYGREAMDIYEAVLAHTEEDDIEFPKDNFSPMAQSLISKLLHPKKSKRLGIVYPGVIGVREHPFFAQFDWEALNAQTMTPPLSPNIVDMKKYTTGTISYDSKMLTVPDDHSGWEPWDPEE